MTPEKFVELVADMRQAQTDYFKARKAGQPIASNLLSRAKDLEAKVDRAVIKLRAKRNHIPHQANLFNP
jgi:hypothetical protein